MHIFLQGRSGVGKSSLLRDIFSPYVRDMAGFVVQRLTENGGAAGFRAISVEDGFPPLLAEYSPGQTGIFILRGSRDISALESAIVDVERQSRDPRYKLVILDEIGGVELMSSAFMEPLYRILSGKRPCIGVFKSHENLTRLSSAMGLGAEYAVLHRDLEEFILSRGEILTMTEDNREEIRGRLVSRFIPLLTGNLSE